MSSPRDGWSTPALYGRPVIPPATTGADPMTSLFVGDWDDDGDETEHGTWSTTTYSGPRRHRPANRAAGGVIEAVAAPDGAPPGEAVAAEGADDERSHRGLMAASRTMAVANLASRITGFLRSSALVAAIGIHGVGNAYSVANNFPNMVYELLLGGVLSSVLIPLLIGAQEQDEDDGVAYTQRLLSIATAALAVITLLAVACAPLLAAGFVDDPDQQALTTVFATLLLPEIFFYGIGAMFMSVLNIRHSYAPGAWSPVLNNVIMIVTVGTFFALPGPNSFNPSTITTAQVLVLGIGTTLGIAAQALVLIPPLRRAGFRWKWRFRAHPNEVGRMREVGNLAFWVLGYVVASQIGVTVIARVGVANDAFTVFSYADLLLQMPYGILVVSLLTALMPRLSRAAARRQTDDVIADLGLGARLSAVALLPVTVGLVVLGPALGVVLFGYGQTSVDGARLIGLALAVSAFGLYPFALVMLQLRVFYAMRDGRTPTLINVCMVGTKVVLVLVSSSMFDTPAHVAEALTVSTSASYVVGAVVGHIALSRRLGRLHFGSVLTVVARIGIASLIGGAAALGVVVALGRALGDAHAGSAASLIGGAVVGGAVLGVVAWRMRIPEVRDIVSLARRG